MFAIFACLKCKEERVYGTEDPHEFLSTSRQCPATLSPYLMCSKEEKYTTHRFVRMSQIPEGRMPTRIN